MIAWQGLELQVTDDGALTHVRLAGSETDAIARLVVRFAPGWRQVGCELLADEIEQRFSCEGATAVVRQVLDDTWTLRVQISNQTANQITVPACWLELDTAWPARTWLAGAEGSISIDMGDPDGRLLTFTQLRGRSRFSEDCIWLTDLPVRLAPKGSPGAVYQVGWRADWLRDERMQAAALPAWWPERTVLAADDVVELHLPDAAVEAAGIGILEDDEATVLTAQPGVHIAQVHAGRGTTDMELAWVPPEREVVARAGERLLAADPRTLSAPQVFLLGRALAAEASGQEAAELLSQSVEELVARPGAAEPLAVAALADQVMRTAEPDMVDALAPLVRRLAPVPGATLAMLHANLALQLAGQPPAVPERTPGDGVRQPVGLAQVADAIRRTELLAMRPGGELPDEALRLAALLGAGLPGRTVDQVTRALVWAVTGALAENWCVPGGQDRWPVALGSARDLAKGRLLAEHCEDEALAWLQW
ncbi:hypothetical protein GCM10009599_14270 [Luteococcus peritonei]